MLSIAIEKASGIFYNAKPHQGFLPGGATAISAKRCRTPALQKTVLCSPYLRLAEYMHKTKNGGMRQPVFKGLRDDKAPEECTI